MSEGMSGIAGDRNFDALAKAMKGNPRPLALIGAGASIPSGYPSWSGLMDGLETLVAAHAQTSAAPQGPPLPPKYQSFLKGQDPAWQAEEYRRVLTPAVFDEHIRETFQPRPTVAEPHHMIAKLGFSHYLTTNFDPCIDRALTAAGKACTVVDWHRTPDLNHFICNIAGGGDQRFVVHLHGRYVDPRRVVLTETSYVHRYLATDDTRLKLLAIFMTHPVVFIGFSMTDPDLTQLMREVAGRLRRSPPRHFAIMGAESDEEAEQTRTRMTGKFGVQPVFYRTVKTDKQHYDHSGLLALLVRLADATGVEATPRESDMTTRTPGSIAAVYESDPNKGRFGGSATDTQHGRRLRLAAWHEAEPGLWMILTFIVESIDPAPALAGPVRFHLHPTFPVNCYEVTADQGGARFAIESTGAFTVGVEADGGATRLELDLALETSLPEWFRTR